MTHINLKRFFLISTRVLHIVTYHATQLFSDLSFLVTDQLWNLIRALVKGKSNHLEVLLLQ